MRTRTLRSGTRDEAAHGSLTHSSALEHRGEKVGHAAAPGQRGSVTLLVDPSARLLRILHGGMTTTASWPAGSATDVLAADGTLAELLSDGVPAIPQPGERLFVQGAPADHAAIVLNGMVKKTRGLPDGTTSVLDFCGPGSLLGLVEALAPGTPHLMTCTAATRDTLAWLVPADRFRSVLHDPGTGPVLMSVFAEDHARDVHARSASRLPPAARLATLLTDLGERVGRTGPVDGSEAIVIGDVSQTDLSTATGLSGASVERTLRTWRDKGIVDTRYRRLVLLDPARLRALCDGYGRAREDPSHPT